MIAAMGDFSVVSLKEQKGPCVLCGAETGVGVVGWRHQGGPVGPVCDSCRAAVHVPAKRVCYFKPGKTLRLV